MSGVPGLASVFVNYRAGLDEVFESPIFIAGIDQKLSVDWISCGMRVPACGSRGLISSLYCCFCSELLVCPRAIVVVLFFSASPARRRGMLFVRYRLIRTE